MPQRLAKLLWLWICGEESKRESERGGGPVAHTVLGKDNAISDV